MAALKRTIDSAYYAKLIKHLESLTFDIKTALNDLDLTNEATLGVVYYNAEQMAKWCEELQHASNRDLSNL